MYKSRIKLDEGQLQQQQQQQEFPIVCSSCLGDNPFMTMTKSENDKECKICSKPFVVFRWKPGTHARFKKTEICKTCATVKNVCQVCIHDLQFGLPVQIRDAALMSRYEHTPTTEINMAYQSAINEQLLESGKINFDSFQPTEIINKLVKSGAGGSGSSDPYRHKRNQAKICSFYLKGSCNRGDTCPYRHSDEEEHDQSLRDQNIKDRYHGQNDIVANKMLNRIKAPPADKSITTLYLSGVDQSKITESDLRVVFFPYGNISELKLVPAKSLAFITFESRESAENAIQESSSNLEINNIKVNLSWANKSNKKTNNLVSNYEEEEESVENPSSQPSNSDSNNNNNENNKQNSQEESKEESNKPTEPPQQPIPPKPVGIKTFPTFKFNANPAVKSNNPKPYYASMDPSSYGSK